jgi:PKD repeat protein
MKKLVLTLSLALPAMVFSNAQQALPCGLVQATEELRAKNPGLYQMELNLAAQQQDEEQTGSGNERAVKIIPVVIHIIHNYGSENISDAQVHDAIRILNEDFQLRQPDTANIASAFKSIQGKPDFEFRLARKDPSGNCTNGITRTVSSHTYNANEDAKSIAPIWPRNKYLNVWVVQQLENGAGGYTYTPGTASFMPGADGIILVNRQFGGIGTSGGGALSRRTLSHEVGHWFNLQHTWGGSNTPGLASNCSQDDGVTDTPNTIGIASQNCNTAFVSCGVLSNVQNIMDYSSCPIMFTVGQANRIVSAANSSTASRNNLWTNANLVATGVVDGFSDTICVPKADFNSATRFVCVGTSLTFTNLTSNSPATTTAWTFTNTTDGTTVVSSSDINPTINFTVPGLYSVTLTSTNSAGTNTVTKAGYVRVYPSTAQNTANSYSDDFEGDLNAAGWFTLNSNSVSGWKSTNTASVSGNTSMMAANFSGGNNESHYLISPSYNLSTVASPKFRFKYAYAERLAANDDRLRVYASSNCGNTWIQLTPSLTHANLITGPITPNTVFVPTAAQWVEKEFILTSSLANQTNVRFRFEMAFNGGNNLYLDDINILSGTASINEMSSTTGLVWDVFPNPADDYVDIRIVGNDNISVSDNMLICDASGRVVISVPVNGTPSTMRADVSALSSGIYFIKSEKGNFAGTKKIIVR